MPDRIIKESALTSETLAELSDFAERLFFRLTVTADDYGRFNANIAVIRGRCMPLVSGATEKRVEAALTELAAAGHVRLYAVEGKRYGEFTGWAKHQRTRQGVPKYPAAAEAPEVAASRGESPLVAALNENVNENVNVNGSDHVHVDDAISVQELYESWNELCPPVGLAAVRELSASRKQKASARIREHPKVAFWNDVFREIKRSAFLRGMGPANGKDPWRANFDWLIENDTNCIKVAEGRYGKSDARASSSAG